MGNSPDKLKQHKLDGGKDIGAKLAPGNTVARNTKATGTVSVTEKRKKERSEVGRYRSGSENRIYTDVTAPPAVHTSFLSLLLESHSFPAP